MAFFDIKTADQYGQSLIDYMPNGGVFVAKNIEGSNIRRFLLALGAEILRSEQSINTLACQFFPQDTIEYIDDWERLVGIPDDCFPGTGDLETRRNHVLIKLASLNAATVEDFERICALFGLECQITSGIAHHHWPWTMPHLWFDSDKEARFTMVVNLPFSAQPSTWPWIWPHPWGADETILQCLFNKLKPANVQVKFLFTL